MAKQNYDNQMTAIIGGFGNEKPKLLLHVCCAPCATYCLTQLLPHFDVTLYFSNDNIMPRAEYDRRLAEVERLADLVNDGKFVTQAVMPLKTVARNYEPSRYLQAAQGLEGEAEGGVRCFECFVLRLGDAAQYAEQNGFDYFATTLTVSPYKNSDLINEIGSRLASDKVLWLPTDFKKRDGYRQSVELCAKYGIYRQHYCGCVFAMPKED